MSGCNSCDAVSVDPALAPLAPQTGGAAKKKKQNPKTKKRTGKKADKKCGGSFLGDLGQLAIPLGLIAAKEGVEMIKKNDKKAATGKKSSTKKSTGKKSGARRASFGGNPAESSSLTHSPGDANASTAEMSSHAANTNAAMSANAMSSSSTNTSQMSHMGGAERSTAIANEFRRMASEISQFLVEAKAKARAKKAKNGEKKGEKKGKKYKWFLYDGTRDRDPAVRLGGCVEVDLLVNSDLDGLFREPFEVVPEGLGVPDLVGHEVTQLVHRDVHEHVLFYERVVRLPEAHDDALAFVHRVARVANLRASFRKSVRIEVVVKTLDVSIGRILRDHVLNQLGQLFVDVREELRRLLLVGQPPDDILPSVASWDDVHFSIVLPDVHEHDDDHDD